MESESKEVFLRVSLLPILLLSSSLMAGATTIDFNTLPSGTTSLSTYSEYGYTLTAVAGRFDVSTVYGNPGPALQAMQYSTLTVTDGGFFSFASVDVQLPASSAYSDVIVNGWLGGQRIFTDELYGDLSFDSLSLMYFPCCSPAVDTLEIQASQGIVLDNIVGECRAFGSNSDDAGAIQLRSARDGVAGRCRVG